MNCRVIIQESREGILFLLFLFFLAKFNACAQGVATGTDSCIFKFSKRQMLRMNIEQLHISTIGVSWKILLIRKVQFSFCYVKFTGDNNRNSSNLSSEVLFSEQKKLKIKFEKWETDINWNTCNVECFPSVLIFEMFDWNAMKRRLLTFKQYSRWWRYKITSTSTNYYVYPLFTPQFEQTSISLSMENWQGSERVD